MPDQSTFKRFVEVGRVVLINDGPFAGKIAVISEIVDHNRAIIDGPTSGVPRQSFPYRHLTLTPLTVTSLPRGAGTGTIKKLLEKQGTTEKWNESSWAKRREVIASRKKLNDFERFGAMLKKKQVRDLVRKEIKASA
ncbi:60S ribosomal protein L14 [Sistotremastrum niveocremeum HHB9708]|uniref:60S ribosomal protein L14 n=2 Tax=Sistotremastraceae TaxID=3402574 RepID=A0A164Z090_9AGAM|nr:60S ribosomal protein L14 [Sistotremastrum niveocremeum HHB9708]KZT31944.1 ribosomal protein L14 [Sistotremastrum suecicum HHB10207 ss-3]